MPITALYPKAKPVFLDASPCWRAYLFLLCLWLPGISQEAPLEQESPAPGPVAPLADSTNHPVADQDEMPVENPDYDTLALPELTVADSESLVVKSAPIAEFNPKSWKNTSFDLYEISDRRLTEEIWRYSQFSGSPEEGSHQIFLLSDTILHAYMLRTGTQIGKLPDTAVALVRQKIRAGELSHGGGAGLWRNFWNPHDPIQPFLWKTGLEADVTHAITAVPRSTPLIEQHYNITFSLRPAIWLVTEVGAHMSRYGGGLRRNILNPNDSLPNWNYWGGVRPWWHASIGVPGVKWEVALSNRLFPEYYWLDPHGGEGSYRGGRSRAGLPVAVDDSIVRRDGALMREWSREGDPEPSGTNLAQALHLKLGNIRYSAYFDSDIYRSVIHRMMFDEMPAPFGQWGFGFVTADGAAHTLLRLDLVPVRVGFGNPATSTGLRLLFLRLDVAYRELQTFHVGISTSLQLDSRAFRPGDKK
jgi:hypothetical protein